MAKINPYLNFNGNTEEAFNFYRSVFGGEFAMVMRFSDMPPQENCPAPASPEKIMHISLPLSDGHVLMGSDSPDEYPIAMGNNIHISLSVDSQDEADKVFNGLSAGGKVAMPMGKTFWGSYFGMVADKYDINWMVSYDENPGK